MAYPFQMGLQDATSPIVEELLYFHDNYIITLMIMFLISSRILYIISLMLNY